MDHELSRPPSAPFTHSFIRLTGICRSHWNKNITALFYTVMNKQFRVLEKSPLGLVTDKYKFQRGIIQGLSTTRSRSITSL